MILLPQRGVAQLVERRSPKPKVAGSIPVSPATSFWLTTIAMNNDSLPSSFAKASFSPQSGALRGPRKTEND